MYMNTVLFVLISSLDCYNNYLSVLNFLLSLFVHQVKDFPQATNSDKSTYLQKLTWNLFSGLRICTYRGVAGAKSWIAHVLRIVCLSC